MAPFHADNFLISEEEKKQLSLIEGVCGYCQPRIFGESRLKHKTYVRLSYMSDSHKKVVFI